MALLAGLGKEACPFLSFLEFLRNGNIGLADRGGEVLARDGVCRGARRCQGRKPTPLFDRVMRGQAIAREHGDWITM